MKRFILSFIFFIIGLSFLYNEKISSYLYYDFLSFKIEKFANEYIKKIREEKNKIEEIFKNLSGPVPPEWKKLEKISKKFDFAGFILIKDLEDKEIRWYGSVKKFNFSKGMKAIFTTEGVYLLFCEELPYGKIYISSKFPEIKKSILIKSYYFSPPEYFFPLPSKFTPPAYSILYKDEGPPLIGITFNAINFEEFKKIFLNYLKTALAFALFFLILTLKISIFLKLLLLRTSLFLISFEILPFLKTATEKENFSLSLFGPFFSSEIDFFISAIFIYLFTINFKRKFNVSFSIFLLLGSSFFYLFILYEILNSTKIFSLDLILKISILILSSTISTFWLNNLKIKRINIFFIFLLLFLIFFPDKFSLLFLILSSYFLISLKKRNFAFFLISGLWALAPTYIFQLKIIEKYTKESFIFEKINQIPFSIMKIKESFNEILSKWDWNEKFPEIFLIEDRYNLACIFEKKLSLKDYPAEYLIEVFEGEELVSLIQTKKFRKCIIKEDGIFQEEENLYHISYQLYFKEKLWGKVKIHIFFISPFTSKKEKLPLYFGTYDEEKNLIASNSIFMPEKLKGEKQDKGINFLYREGNKFHVFTLPDFEFPFPLFTMGMILILGSLFSIQLPLKLKSVYFLILFPLIAILFFMLLFALFFIVEQRSSTLSFQKAWESFIQKSLISYIEKIEGDLYYKNGILSGGNKIEEKFLLCPFDVISAHPLKKAEVFNLYGENYIFFEDKKGDLIGIKQEKLPEIEKILGWQVENTWGYILTVYAICFYFLINLLEKFLIPLNKLSIKAKEVENGKEFEEVKPIFGAEIEELSKALKSSFIKLQNEEKTLKTIINNLPIGVGLLEDEKIKISNPLLILEPDEIIKLKEEGTFQKNSKIYQYKKVKIDEKRMIFFLNDITSEIEKEKLSIISNIARIVAHEIKNPLTPIKLSLEYLNEIFLKRREEFLNQFPKISLEILESLKDLETLSSEFSDFTRLPELKKERVDFKNLVKSWLEPYILNNKISLEMPSEEIFLEIDQRLIKRAIFNILNNAWQSSDPPPFVHFKIKKEDKIKIEIIDEGPGVPEELLDKIFEPYFTTKTSGTGLGLFISKKIIEEHNGKIKAENFKGKGLRIIIIFDA